jgi:hypothetical protein
MMGAALEDFDRLAAAAGGVHVVTFLDEVLTQRVRHHGLVVDY